MKLQFQQKFECSLMRDLEPEPPVKLSPDSGPQKQYNNKLFFLKLSFEEMCYVLADN